MRAALVLIALIGAACGSSDPAKKPAGPTGTIVVGVQSTELGGLVAGFHVVVKHDGAVVKDETVNGTSIGEAVTVEGAVGSHVDASVDVLPAAGGAPLISRLASTEIVAGGSKLLRMRLETSCVVLNGVGPSCAAPLTCISGACASGEVTAADLEDFTADWQSAPPPDACRPAKPGPAELTLGTGQNDYLALTDGQTLMLEQGPQGGHHVWIAIRMKNLRQAGSTTTITGTVENDPTPVAPLSVVFSFDPDEGGYCTVHGLRFQVDASTLGADGTPQAGPDYHLFLGKRLVVTGEVTDSTGATASDTKTIQIADKIICADGTDACNQSP